MTRTRGELTAELKRAQWEQVYLATETGQDELRFARALDAVSSKHDAGQEDQGDEAEPADAARGWVYGLAAAAVVILAVAAAILMTRPQRRATPPDEADQRPPASPAAPSPSTGPPRFVALTLAAPRRDLSETPTLRVPAGTDEARLTLRLEPNEFDRFDVEVRDASTNRIVWKTARVAAARDADGRSIAIAVPIAALRQGRVVIQLSSVAPRGEIVGEYPLKVVLE